MDTRNDELAEFLYAVGDSVKKRSGYEFPGIVVAAFHNCAGDVRYVVEATHSQFDGMLHIFNQDQLVRQR